MRKKTNGKHFQKVLQACKVGTYISMSDFNDVPAGDPPQSAAVGFMQKEQIDGISSSNLSLLFHISILVLEMTLISSSFFLKPPASSWWVFIGSPVTSSLMDHMVCILRIKVRGCSQTMNDWSYDCTDKKKGIDFFTRLVKWPKIDVKKCQNLIFKVDFQRQKSFESF